MGVLDQIDYLGPAGKLAVQDLRTRFAMLLIPSVHGRPPRSTGGPPQLAGMNIDVGRDSPCVKVVDNDGTILRHAKNRIGDFEPALLITAAHHADRREGAIAKVGDLPVIHEPWLHQKSSALRRLTQIFKHLVRGSPFTIVALILPRTQIIPARDISSILAI